MEHKETTNHKEEQKSLSKVALRALKTIQEQRLATPESPVLLMVSGGSDSTALAYIADELREAGHLGELAMLHVNHHLRGEDANKDAAFVEDLAALLEIPLFRCDIDVAAEAKRTGDNVEAVARRERYLAANEALNSLCLHAAAPVSEGRIFTAHTQDDRVENFYMRSIVGTGPGGFRSMLYKNLPVVRPLLDTNRETLRTYLQERKEAGLPAMADDKGNLWREDATNAHTDRFRAYVRHEIVPLAKARNAQLLETLCRSMNLIADEDDLLESMASEIAQAQVDWLAFLDEHSEEQLDTSAGCVIKPAFGEVPLPLQRRVCFSVLQRILGADARIETASVQAVLDAFEHNRPKGGYVTNIQGNLAVSANKQGVRIEPMQAFRARRKRGE